MTTQLQLINIIIIIKNRPWPGQQSNLGSTPCKVTGAVPRHLSVQIASRVSYSLCSTDSVSPPPEGVQTISNLHPVSVLPPQTQIHPYVYHNDVGQADFGHRIELFSPLVKVNPCRGQDKP